MINYFIGLIFIFIILLILWHYNSYLNKLEKINKSNILTFQIQWKLKHHLDQLFLN